METFHIVLTAIFAAGTCANICVLALVYDKRIHTAFTLGLSALILIVFYSVAAYCIDTSSWWLYWLNLVVNTIIGTYRAIVINREYVRIIESD